MFVNRDNPMLEAGVNISTLPVGVGVDSSLRDASVGLPSQQARGVLPLSPPLFVPSRGVRTNIIQLRKQNAKHRGTRKCVFCMYGRSYLIFD